MPKKYGHIAPLSVAISSLFVAASLVWIGSFLGEAVIRTGDHVDDIQIGAFLEEKAKIRGDGVFSELLLTVKEKGLIGGGEAHQIIKVVIR